MSEATQQGASIEQRLEAYLAGDEAPPEPTVTDEPAPAPEAEDEAPESEDAAAEDVEADEGASEDAQEAEEAHLDVTDLAQYLKLDADKLDVDDDGNVYIKTKVDGEEGRATLQDLVKSYQLEGHLNKQNMEVAEAKKALQTKLADVEQQAQSRLQQLDTLSQLAQQELQQEYQAVNWQQLEQDDPVEYARLSIKYQQRQGRLQQMHQQMQAERQRLQQSQHDAQQQRLREEGEALLRVIPEWKDEAVATKERSEIRNFAVEMGFQPQEVDSVADHRVVALLRDAMRYRSLQKSKPEISKKVKAAPKLVRPGQPASAKDQQAQHLNKMRSAIRSQGSKDSDIAQFLLASGKV